jgi:hypothetical protein
MSPVGLSQLSVSVKLSVVLPRANGVAANKSTQELPFHRFAIVRSTHAEPLQRFFVVMLAHEEPFQRLPAINHQNHKLERPATITPEAGSPA